MKSTFIPLLFLLMIFSTHISYAQEKSEAQIKIEELKAQKETVREAENKKLKKEIAAINERLKNNEISSEEAEKLVKESSERYALNIKDQLKMIELNIDLIQRNQGQGSADYTDAGQMLLCTGDQAKGNDDNGGVYIGFGGTVMLSGSDELNPYKDVGFSMVFGLSFPSIQLSEKYENLRLILGWELGFQNLSLKNNFILVDESGSTNVVEFPADLENSHFGLTSMNVPVHLEYPLPNDFNVGVGGFLGFKLSSVQTYEYDPNNKFMNVSLHRSYNTNNFLYGVSGYVGWKMLKLNVRYNMNPVFQKSNANGHLLSVGVTIGG